MRGGPLKKSLPPPLQSLLAALCMALCVALLVWGQQPPSPKPSNAPARAFSALRALEDLKHIAIAYPRSKIREKGMAFFLQKNMHEIPAKVRAFLQQRVKALGHSPQTQESMIALVRKRHAHFVGQKLTNILVRIKGTQSTGLIVIVAHYDAVLGAPGAGDDKAAVVAMLETMRALKHHKPLKNDVLFLFTDAEEIGLVGAKAFAQKHPWMKEARVVMNFEGRGNTGPSLMFETNQKNGSIIRAFAKGDHAPRTSSLFFEVYRRMPNDTDFTVFKKAGVQGLNFGIIQSVRHYHQATDDIKHLSLASLQDHGEHMLSMVRTLGEMDLQKLHAPNLVYFDIMGRVLFYYPAWLAYVLAFLACVGFFFLFWQAWDKKKIRLNRTLSLFFLYLFSAVSIAFLVGILSHYTLRWRGKHLYSFYYDVLHDGLYNIAFLLLATSLFLGLRSLLMRWFAPLEQAFAAMLLWSTLLGSTTILLIGGSYLFLWPFLGGLLLLWLSMRETTTVDSPHFERGIWGLCEIPLYIVGVPLFYHLPYALTLNLMGAFVFLFVLFFSMAWVSQGWLSKMGGAKLFTSGLGLALFFYLLPLFLH